MSEMFDSSYITGPVGELLEKWKVPAEPVDWFSRLGLVYLATPYSKYKGGIDAAFAAAAELSARLLVRGMRVFSPICHTHPIAIHGKLDPYAHDVWLPFDEAMMQKSDTLVVALMDGWNQSRGVKHEMDFFREVRKPIYFLDPLTLGLV